MKKIITFLLLVTPLVTFAQEKIIFEAATKLIMEMKADTIFVPKGVFSGYGTTDPLDPIHIKAEDDDEYAGFYAEGGANTKHVHYILDNRTSNGRRYSLVSVGDDSSIPNGSFAIRDLNLSVERLTIDSTGRIGINRNNPSAQLDVNGAIKTNKHIKVGTAGENSAGNIQFTSGDFLGYAGGEWKSLTGGGGGVSDKLEDADTDTKVIVEETADSDEIKFTANDALVLTMKEDTIYVPKGVFSGYGTMEPLDPIHVVAEDDDEFAGFYAEGGTGTKHVHYILDNRTANGKRYSLVSVGDDSSIPNGSFAIRDLDNSTERLLIDANGNVGINENNPSDKLHVNGGTLLTNSLGTSPILTLKEGESDDLARLYFRNEGSTNRWSVAAQPGAPVNNDFLISYNGAVRLVATEGNRVYIYDTLNVLNAIEIDNVMKASTNGNGDAEVRVGNGINDRLYVGNDYFTDGGANILRTNAHFTPAADDARNLGGSSFRWKNIFATNSVINTSDIRAKKNIVDMSYGLEDVLKLRPVDFNWKNGKKDDQKTLGLIAQELAEIIPEVVVAPENEDELYGVKYADLVPVLIQAIQDLDAKVQALEARLEK